MSDQNIKTVSGLGRTITKTITTIERATPSIINLESLIDQNTVSIDDNWTLDGTQNSRIDALELDVSNNWSTDTTQNTRLTALEVDGLTQLDFLSLQNQQGWQELAGGIILEWGFKAKPILTFTGGLWLSNDGNINIGGWQRLEKIPFLKITTPLFAQGQFEASSYTARDEMWPLIVVAKNSTGISFKAAEATTLWQSITGISWFAIGY